LKKLFLKSNNLVKHKILDSLNNIYDNCINNKFINHFVTFESTPDPQVFIDSLCDYDIRQLETIIEIGLFLEEYYCDLYLADFLESNIECYIDVNRSHEDKAYDDYADDIDKILNSKNKFYLEKTNAQVLDKLLSNASVNYRVEHIKEANEKRRARMNGENSSEDFSDDD